MMLFRACIVVSLIAVGFSLPLQAATFTVDSLLNDPDSNPGDGICDIPAGGPTRCTLRAAIMEANAASHGSVHRIEFDTTGVIAVFGTPLPTISNRVEIDGRTAPTYSEGDNILDSPPAVSILGSSLTGSNDDGLRFEDVDFGGVFAISITGFPDNGIELIDSTLIDISGNWIGRRDGADLGNDGSGVLALGCDRCTIGSTISTGGPAIIENLGNILTLSGEDGLFMQFGGENVIGGNEVFGNGRHGMQIFSNDSKIGEIRGLAGGESLTTGNVIIENAANGILAGANNLEIYANTIGLNGDDGIGLDGSNGRIGFTNPAMRNVIASNSGFGIRLGPSLGAQNTVIQNQLIANNGSNGIDVVAGGSNEIVSNEIAGNADGIRVFTDDNEIAVNDIGLIDGTVVGGRFNGISVVGSSNIVRGNTIGGMDDDGIDVNSGDDNEILNNSIGTRSDGSDIGNGNVGVRVRSAANGTLVEGNRIGNNFDGVAIGGGGTRICGNAVGIGASNQNAGNADAGIWVIGGGNVIGDPANGCCCDAAMG